MTNVIHGIRLSTTAQTSRAPARSMPCRSDAEADHQAGLVGEVDERQVERVAQLDEAERLAAGGDVGGAAEVERVVGHDPDRVARRRGPGR